MALGVLSFSPSCPSVHLSYPSVCLIRPSVLPVSSSCPPIRLVRPFVLSLRVSCLSVRPSTRPSVRPPCVSVCLVRPFVGLSIRLRLVRTSALVRSSVSVRPFVRPSVLHHSSRSHNRPAIAVAVSASRSQILIILPVPGGGIKFVAIAPSGRAADGSTDRRTEGRNKGPARPGHAAGGKAQDR